MVLGPEGHAREVGSQLVYVRTGEASSRTAQPMLLVIGDACSGLGPAFRIVISGGTGWSRVAAGLRLVFGVLAKPEASLYQPGGPNLSVEKPKPTRPRTPPNKFARWSGHNR
jgi:hypothetical protein